MNWKIYGLFVIAVGGLSGCSATGDQLQPSCELMTAQICSRAAETQLQDGTLAIGDVLKPEEAHVVPLVVPVMRQDGVLAAEVDCYVNADPRSYSLVRSNLAIAPASEESVDFLEARHLCADYASYAEDNQRRLETGSANPLSMR